MLIEAGSSLVVCPSGAKRRDGSLIRKLFAEKIGERDYRVVLRIACFIAAL